MTTAADDTINVPDYIEGDYTTRYRGPGIPEHAILDGDVLVLAKPEDRVMVTGTLVVVINEEKKAQPVEYEPGMEIAGVVTGVMRKVALREWPS